MLCSARATPQPRALGVRTLSSQLFLWSVLSVAIQCLWAVAAMFAALFASESEQGVSRIVSLFAKATHNDFNTFVLRILAIMCCIGVTKRLKASRSTHRVFGLWFCEPFVGATSGEPALMAIPMRGGIGQGIAIRLHCDL